MQTEQHIKCLESCHFDKKFKVRTVMVSEPSVIVTGLIELRGIERYKYSENDF